MAMTAGLVLAGGTTAKAQEGHADEAQWFTRSGDRRFSEGRYPEALAEYEDAYALSARPELLYQMARCHERMIEPVEAIERYRSYLKARPDAPERAAIERSLAALLPGVGKIAVETNVAGALIVVDGRQVGRTPLAPLLVRAGRHEVIARRIGHAQASAIIDVDGGTMAPPLRLTLAPLEPATATKTPAARSAATRVPTPEEAALTVEGTPASGAAPSRQPGAHSPHRGQKARTWPRWATGLLISASVLAIAAIAGGIVYGIYPEFYYCTLQGRSCLRNY